jgi:protoporphyrinogen oxidase
LAEVCGSKNIQTGSIITKIFHDQNRIQEVQINGDQRIKIDHTVNSLPLGLFIRMMEPAVPEKILSLANSLRFRNLVLVGLFLDRAMVTENASMYFPEGVFPFTRVYEPKRRSEFMAPPGKTSLIVEIPCHKEDKIWNTKDDEIVRFVLPSLSNIFSIKENEIIDSQVVRLGNAYPVLEKGFEKKVEEILLFLSMFSNMRLAGRNGKFEYSHSIHNMMKFGQEVIDAYVMN